jgi:tRNA U34 5-carboxymethylaminomethyl modifying GTPase MnmE/TrmE
VHDLETTIVAVATAPGRGGIGCVRLSGPQAQAIAGHLFNGSLALDGRARFGRMLARDGTAIDHGFAVGFPETAAYTGQSTVELWAHGSPVVLAELRPLLVAAEVCRLAYLWIHGQRKKAASASDGAANGDDGVPGADLDIPF